MRGLQGKLTVITGGGRGIGFSIAKKFAEEKARIVIADIRIEQAEQACAELTAMGVECYAYQVDVSKVDQIEAFFASLQERFGAVDILVNNAGIQIRNPSMDYLEADWDQLMGST